MTERLPVVGGDDGVWGPILNGFLEVSLNADGTMKLTAIEAAGGAPLASPMFTGIPEAPTQSALDDSTKLATTAYADTAVGVETARAEAAEALLAPLASPALTGTPTAPTASPGTNTTEIATTAFVETAVSGSDSGWINLTLLNSWVNDATARYRKINGVVYLDMAVSGGSTTTVANLPTGFRPATNDAVFIIPVADGGDPLSGQLTVDSSGGTAGNILIAHFTGSVPTSGEATVSFVAGA